MQEQNIVKILPAPSNPPKETLLSRSKKHELDKIGDVINEQNVQIDTATKEKIILAKKDFNMKNDLKDKEKMLEQSFADRHSSIQDIKDLQNKIVENRNKLKMEVKNTEKWEPSFVYYLMINENYSYSDINQIQSLSENGFNAEELNYINEVVRTKAFHDKISEFKGHSEVKRKVATATIELKDDYIDNPIADAPSLEEKMIEMNYSHQQKEEMKYGRSQQN